MTTKDINSDLCQLSAGKIKTERDSAYSITEKVTYGTVDCSGQVVDSYELEEVSRLGVLFFTMFGIIAVLALTCLCIIIGEKLECRSWDRRYRKEAEERRSGWVS